MFKFEDLKQSIHYIIFGNFTKEQCEIFEKKIKEAGKLPDWISVFIPNDQKKIAEIKAILYDEDVQNYSGTQEVKNVADSNKASHVIVISGERRNPTKAFQAYLNVLSTVLAILNSDNCVSIFDLKRGTLYSSSDYCQLHPKGNEFKIENEIMFMGMPNGKLSHQRFTKGMIKFGLPEFCISSLTLEELDNADMALKKLTDEFVRKGIFIKDNQTVGSSLFSQGFIAQHSGTYDADDDFSGNVHITLIPRDRVKYSNKAREGKTKETNEHALIEESCSETKIEERNLGDELLEAFFQSPLYTKEPKKKSEIRTNTAEMFLKYLNDPKKLKEANQFFIMYTDVSNDEESITSLCKNLKNLIETKADSQYAAMYYLYALSNRYHYNSYICDLKMQNLDDVYFNRSAEHGFILALIDQFEQLWGAPKHGKRKDNLFVFKNPKEGLNNLLAYPDRESFPSIYYLLGENDYFGKIGERDITTGVRLLCKAADHNIIGAMGILHDFYNQEGEASQASLYQVLSAKQCLKKGDLRHFSFFVLSDSFLDGCGTKRNLNAALLCCLAYGSDYSCDIRANECVELIIKVHAQENINILDTIRILTHFGRYDMLVKFYNSEHYRTDLSRAADLLQTVYDHSIKHQKEKSESCGICISLKNEQLADYDIDKMLKDYDNFLPVFETRRAVATVIGNNNVADIITNFAVDLPRGSN